MSEQSSALCAEMEVTAGDRLSSSPTKERRSRQPAAQGKRQVVLVVDDEPIITETLVDILQHEGFEAVPAADGMSAVEKATELKPDILLADVSMPRLNGVEAAKRILLMLPKVRVVLFSGQAETADLLAQAREEGYDFEVLAKPVRPDQLLRTLRRQ